ncbi:MAG: hypothetical protein WDM96_18810 [Lacunisphaera sp.]
MSSPTKSSGSNGWILKLLVALLVLAGLAYGVNYVLRPAAQVVAASRTTAVRSVPGTVEVKSEFDVELKSEVSGRVKTTELEIGRKFFKGDTLVTIDTGDIDLEIERIKNDLVAAKRRVEIGSTLRAEVENQRDTLDNLERQVKAGSYPQAEFEKAKRLYQQARAAHGSRRRQPASGARHAGKPVAGQGARAVQNDDHGARRTAWSPESSPASAT